MNAALPRAKAAYRADIQGIRAIAVLAVVLFHARPAWLPGGFLGVDAFFVLSGFLITGMLIEGGTLSEFYRRRAMRILPVYSLVSALVMIGGVCLFLPNDLIRLAKSLVYSAFFAANVYFGREASYFEPATELQPLLHYWSLAIEEQFYILWPLLFGLVCLFLPRARVRAWIVTELALIGVFFSWQSARAHPDDAYMSFAVRFMEPLVGATIANIWASYRESPRFSVPRGFAEGGGLVALGLMATAFFFCDGNSVLPGVGAAPVLASVATLLFLGEVHPGNLASRFLSVRALEYIGRISYPLYMVHWSLFAFLRYVGIELRGLAFVGGIAASFGLAALISWTIEEPLRRRPWKLRKALAVFLLVPAGLSLGLNRWISSSGGLPQRASAKAAQMIAWQNEFAHEARQGCHIDSPDLNTTSHCILGDLTKTPAALLWGDSFANHYSGFLDVIARHDQFAVRDVTANSCPPILGLTAVRPWCITRNRSVVAYLQAHPEIKTVYAAGQWSLYLGDRHPVTQADFEKTVRTLADLGKRVIFLADPPPLPISGIDCPSKREFYRGLLSTVCDFSAEPREETLAVLRRSGDLLDPVALFCDGSRCRQEIAGTPLYRAGDSEHLCVPGSMALARAYLERP